MTGLDKVHAILDDMVFGRPDVEARCLPGVFMRRDGDDIVGFMLDAAGEQHEVGRVALAWLARETMADRRPAYLDGPPPGSVLAASDAATADADQDGPDATASGSRRSRR